MRRWRCLKSHNNFHRRFRVHHQKQGRLITKSLGCESSGKCDSTKLERDRLQDERALLAIQVFHHEDVASMSNVKMTMGLTFHLLT
jgi:hypothetical protein